MKALIDADILVYRVGFTTQEEDINIAKWRMNELIKSILTATKATSHQLYLTASHDTTAFRKQIYPDYKANRKAPRPVHYDALRQYLIDEHQAAVSTTIEADDAIGIDSCNGDCVVVSIDKDLLQLPGLHYNFVKNEFKEVTAHGGLRFFYEQCLKGDAADNIKGVPGIGEKKAGRLLTEAEQTNRFLEDSEYCWFEAVREAYNNDAEFFKNGECLWILKKPFPQGTWSCHPLGSQLIQETDKEQLYSQRRADVTLGVFTQEMSTDGSKQLGLSLAAASTTQESLQLSI